MDIIIIIIIILRFSGFLNIKSHTATHVYMKQYLI